MNKKEQLKEVKKIIKRMITKARTLKDIEKISMALFGVFVVKSAAWWYKNDSKRRKQNQ